VKRGWRRGGKVMAPAARESEMAEVPREVADELRRLTLTEDLGEAIVQLLMDLRTYVRGYEGARDIVDRVRDMEAVFGDERGWIVFRGKIVRLLAAIYAAVKAQVEEADQAILRMYGGGEPGLEERLRLLESRERVLEDAEERAVAIVREIFRYLREAAREERRRLVGR
jgi:hypothetical protein